MLLRSRWGATLCLFVRYRGDLVSPVPVWPILHTISATIFAISGQREEPVGWTVTYRALQIDPTPRPVRQRCWGHEPNNET